MTCLRALVLALLLGATAGCAEGLRGGLARGGEGGDASAGDGEDGPGEGGAASPGGAGGAVGAPAADASSGATGGSSGVGGEGGGSPTSTGQGGASSTGTTSPTSGGGAVAGTVFFSEYVEGAGYDKALEIVNAGPTPVSLAGCVLDRYQNGASSPTSPLELDAVQLAPGATHVVCHVDFSAPALCDELDAGIQHTGNDAIALRCDGDVEDVFGRIGEDAVWGSSPATSKDSVLRRRCEVVEGDRDGQDPFDPGEGWESFAADELGDLGLRSCP